DEGVCGVAAARALHAGEGEERVTGVDQVDDRGGQAQGGAVDVGQSARPAPDPVVDEPAAAVGGEAAGDLVLVVGEQVQRGTTGAAERDEAGGGLGDVEADERRLEAHRDDGHGGEPDRIEAGRAGAGDDPGTGGCATEGTAQLGGRDGGRDGGWRASVD